MSWCVVNLLLILGVLSTIPNVMLLLPSLRMERATPRVEFGLLVTSQHVGQFQGILEGFCAYHLKLQDFFALLSLKPKRDRVSL
jgi:hypothetical protein